MPQPVTGSVQAFRLSCTPPLPHGREHDAEEADEESDVSIVPRKRLRSTSQVLLSSTADSHGSQPPGASPSAGRQASSDAVLPPPSPSAASNDPGHTDPGVDDLPFSSWVKDDAEAPASSLSVDFDLPDSDFALEAPNPVFDNPSPPPSSSLEPGSFTGTLLALADTDSLVTNLDPSFAAPGGAAPPPTAVGDTGQAASPELPPSVKLCVGCGAASDTHVNWVAVDAQEHLVWMRYQAASNRFFSGLGGGGEPPAGRSEALLPTPCRTPSLSRARTLLGRRSVQYRLPHSKEGVTATQDQTSHGREEGRGGLLWFRVKRVLEEVASGRRPRSGESHAPISVFGRGIFVTGNEFGHSRVSAQLVSLAGVVAQPNVSGLLPTCTPHTINTD
ncbi:hypothetical protein PG984_010556 [Apiospora sp. TS-2023a]